MSIILIRERKESVEREGRRGGRTETLCEEPCEKAMGEVRLLFTGKGGPWVIFQGIVDYLTELLLHVLWVCNSP